MEEKIRFKKKLIAVEIELGFLYVPIKDKNALPPESSVIGIFVRNSKFPKQVKWNHKIKRIYGLVEFYRLNKAKPGDKVLVEFLGGKAYKISFIKNTSAEGSGPETQQEAEQLIDLSQLSSQAKGDIVEDRIKELILLYGQGLLNVYKPTNDAEGIDLIVVKNGIFQPIFLQVKSNYKLHTGKNLLVQVGDKTFKSHHTMYIVGAYFDPKKLEVHDKIALIPSNKMDKKGNVVKFQKGKTGKRMTIPLSENSHAKHIKYIIKKTDFVNKLLEKFSEIEKVL
jgi:hypothetical protein